MCIFHVGDSDRNPNAKYSVDIQHILSFKQFESFSLANSASFSEFQFKTFYDHFEVPQNEIIDTAHYRWSKDRLIDYMGLNEESRLLATCNMDIHLNEDYLLMPFSPEFVWDNVIANECYMVDSANIRGYHCTGDTIGIISVAENAHFHIDSSRCACGCCDWFNGSIVAEDNFGFYLNVNPMFSCTANSQSTTNYWIGSVIEHSTEITTTPFYTTSMEEYDISESSTTIFPSEYPTNSPTTSPTPFVTLIENQNGGKHAGNVVLVLVLVALVVILIVSCGCFFTVSHSRERFGQTLVFSNSLAFNCMSNNLLDF